VARITCKTPSTGKAIIVSQTDVTTTYTSIAEAPDFSLPDPSETFSQRDPSDNARAIRPGEVFFITPLSAKNKTANTRWIEVRLYTEANTAVEFGRVSVPPNDTAFIPLQGRSLFKRNANNAVGDSLQVRAEANNVFDVWAAAEEKLSAEHIGVV
jgi:hypothetical protein